jgi:hypothetical protein
MAVVGEHRRKTAAAGKGKEDVRAGFLSLKSCKRRWRNKENEAAGL